LGRRVVTGLAVEATWVAVVAAGASLVAVVGVAAAVVEIVVVAIDVEVVVVAVTSSLDVAAPGDGFGEHAATAATEITTRTDRAGTRRTYAAPP
jgi:hypothetical protein